MARHLFLLSLGTGFVYQALYFALAAYSFGPAIAFSSFVLLLLCGLAAFVSLQPAHRTESSDRVSSSFEVFWVVCALFVTYFLAISILRFAGSSSAEFLSIPIVLLAASLLIAIMPSIFGPSRRVLCTVLIVTSLCALVHVANAALTVNFDLLNVQYQQQRYGYFEDRNLVNVTGFNLSLIVLVLCRIASSHQLQGKFRAVAAAMAVAVIIPILAGGSRTAIVVTVGGVAFIALTHVTKKSLRPVVISFIACFVSYFIFTTYFPEAVALSIARFSWAPSAVQSARSEGIRLAFDSGDGFLFGQGHMVSELLGRGTDTFFASSVISYGLFGLLLSIALLLTGVFVFSRQLGSGRTVALVLIFPLVVRSLAEDALLSPSSFFPYMLFAFTLVVAAELPAGAQPHPSPHSQVARRRMTGKRNPRGRGGLG